MPPLSEDTAPWAEELLVRHWRSMSLRDKAELLTALCGSLHRLTLAGLRARHPELDDEELHFEAACLRIGRELAERVRADRPRSTPPST